MLITAVVFNNKTRFINVEIDYKSGFFLRSSNTVTDCNVVKGRELNEDDLSGIIKIDLKNYFLNKSLELIARRIRSEVEIKNYLNEKIFLYNQKSKFTINESDSLFLVSEIIDSLIKNNYINDSEFAKQFFQSRMKRNQSLNRIKSDLIKKGISKDIIENMIKSMEDFDEVSSAVKVAQKKMERLRNEDIMKKKQKISMYLSSKGYNWKTISEVINHLL